MLKFLRFLFPSLDGIPSTASYEKKLLEEEQNYARFLEIRESDEYKRYLELKDYVLSPEYKKDIAKLKALSYANSHEEHVERQYKKVKANKDVKKYIETGEGLDLAVVGDFIKLRDEIESEEFVKKTQFLKNKKRYKESEPYIKYIEYNRLDKSDAIRHFFKLQKKHAQQFAEQEQWASKLYDDFTKNEIDTSRWLTKPYWGEVLLRGSYSQSNELQLTSDGKNLQSGNSALRITTRRENANGLAWDEKMGFIPKTFQYTSGIISTASSFRQLYGKFEAKVRVNKAANAYHAFWMAADKKLPHLNVFKFTGDKLSCEAYNKLNGALHAKEQGIKHKLNDDYYIYTLLWDEKNITWLINGKIVCECANIFNEPMYIAFSSGIIGEIAEQRLPIEMEIDWIRCFRRS